VQILVQVARKLTNLLLAHLGWMTNSVEKDEPLDPGHVGLFGLEAITSGPDRQPHLIQKLGFGRAG
jgi:hypothetical protein